MRCERQSRNAIEPVDRAEGLLTWWHRLWCEECRRSYAVDLRIDRASAYIRTESVPADSLARTLAAVGCPVESLSTNAFAAKRAALGRALALVGVGIFVTTLAQPEKIGMSLFGASQSPGASARGVAGFWALLGLFWYLKPVAALLIESMPAIVSRRKLCLLVSVLGAATLWLLPAMKAHATEALAPALGIAINAALALASTILGGYLVEQAQRIGATGRLGALHQAAAQIAGIAAPILGIVTGRAAPPVVAAILLAFLGVLAAFVFPKEGSPTPGRKALGAATQMRVVASARDLWRVSALLVLVFGVSSFDALLSGQQAMRGFSSEQRLHLLWIGHGAILTSISAYAILCRRVRLQSLLPVGILANAVGTLLYLAYAGPVSFGAAAVIEIVNGLASALIMVTLFDLAVRAVPVQCPYLGYAILMSVTSAARALSEVTTASLPVAFSTIIVLSAITSSLALLLVVRLPAGLVNRREGEASPGAALAAVGG